MKCAKILRANSSNVWVRVSDLKAGHCHDLVLQIIGKEMNYILIINTTDVRKSETRHFVLRWYCTSATATSPSLLAHNKK